LHDSVTTAVSKYADMLPTYSDFFDASTLGWEVSHPELPNYQCRKLTAGLIRRGTEKNNSHPPRKNAKIAANLASAKKINELHIIFYMAYKNATQRCLVFDKHGPILTILADTLLRK